MSEGPDHQGLGEQKGLSGDVAPWHLLTPLPVLHRGLERVHDLADCLQEAGKNKRYSIFFPPQRSAERPTSKLSSDLSRSLTLSSSPAVGSSTWRSSRARDSLSGRGDSSRWDTPESRQRRTAQDASADREGRSTNLEDISKMQVM